MTQSVAFPPPPLKGDTVVAPITSAQELYAESRVTGTGIETLTDTVCATSYFYRVLHPAQRCILGVRLVPPGRWMIHFLGARREGPVDDAVLQTVIDWLRRTAAYFPQSPVPGTDKIAPVLTEPELKDCAELYPPAPDLRDAIKRGEYALYASREWGGAVAGLRYNGSVWELDVVHTRDEGALSGFRADVERWFELNVQDAAAGNTAQAPVNYAFWEHELLACTREESWLLPQDPYSEEHVTADGNYSVDEAYRYACSRLMPGQQGTDDRSMMREDIYLVLRLLQKHLRELGYPGITETGEPVDGDPVDGESVLPHADEPPPELDEERAVDYILNEADMMGLTFTREFVQDVLGAENDYNRLKGD